MVVERANGDGGGRGDIVAGLARYDCDPRKFGERVVRRGRVLGSYIDKKFRPPGGLQSILRAWGSVGVMTGRPVGTAIR